MRDQFARRWGTGRGTIHCVERVWLPSKEN